MLYSHLQQNQQSLTTEITLANKAYFSKGGPIYTCTYANQAQYARISSYVASAIVSKGLPLAEDSTRVLDYACGQGAISQALASHVKEIVGIDTSPDMVEIYNTAVSNQGIPAEDMHAIVADICLPEVGKKLTAKEYLNFDLAICSLALHHTIDPGLVVKKMAERLKPSSGHLFIVDFRKHMSLTDMPEGEKYKNVVPHSGFIEDDIKNWYEEAGLVDVEFIEIGPKGKLGRGTTVGAMNCDTGKVYKFKRELFLVSGRRP